MQTIREDGLRIITKNLPYTKKANLMLIAGIGSAGDAQGKGGLAHFFEHMAFQGTTTRHKDEIKAIFERYSFHHNATTWPLQTRYYADTVKEHLPIICNLICDMYFRNSFPEQEIEKERNVIKHEIERFWDEDNKALSKNIDRLMYTPKHPFFRHTLGTKEELDAMGRKDFLELKDTWYVPAGTAVIATGNVDHAEICEMINKEIPIQKKEVPELLWSAEEDVLPSQTEFILERPNREKALFVLELKIKSLSHAERQAFAVLMKMIGGGMDSMMFKEIREKRGWAYETGSNWGGTDPLGRSALFSAQTSPKNIADLKKLVPEIILEYPLDEKHFERVKGRFDDETQVDMERPGDWEGMIASLLMNRRLEELSDVEGYNDRMDKLGRAVTFEDIKNIRKLFRPEYFIYGIMVPNKAAL